MTDLSPRLGLPLLAAGQAQKEIFHNEALIALEALVQPVAETIGDNVPPEDPQQGKSWIVGANPVGEWAGQADTIASRTPGGWRFAAPQEGMACWIVADRVRANRIGGIWKAGAMTARSLSVAGQQVVGARQPGIADPSGGGVVDTEARAAISAILGVLTSHGLIGSA